MSDKPFWKSIRGVGLPGTHKPTWEGVTMAPKPKRDYTNFVPDESTRKPMLKVQRPRHDRCGLLADEHDKRPNTWWCNFCWEEVHAPMRPNAMVPLEQVEASGHLLPSLTDPKGQLICPKCATSRLPRADNQGWDCKCGVVYHWPGVPRASPTNGF